MSAQEKWLRSNHPYIYAFLVYLSGCYFKHVPVHPRIVLFLQELERKVSQTTPFKNLKSMLVKKNATLKDLRRRLAK